VLIARGLAIAQAASHLLYRVVKQGLALLIGSLLFVTNSRAVVIGGVEFPSGASSFADAVASYDPVIVAGQPVASARNSANSLGVPNGGSVSLGDGGSVTLRFTDNSLTGSGSAALDLWIFEIGPDVEDTFVEISKNGTTWLPVGKVFGATSGIDIDAFGFDTSDFFSYVRLTDDPNEGDQSGSTVGADIDAVGAISSAPPVSTPDGGSTAAIIFLSSGLLLAAHRRRIRR
jgi:hypothetical protein